MAVRYDQQEGTFHDRTSRSSTSRPSTGTRTGWRSTWKVGSGRDVRRAGGAALRPGRARLTRSIELPVRDITSCAFGGPDRTTLYITTSREGWGEAHAEPEAGAVFVFETGVAGAEQYTYAG